MAEREKTVRTKRQRKKREVNYTFTVMLAALVAFGLVMVFSASSPRGHYMYFDAFYFFKRQAIFAAMGIVAMYIISKFHYKIWYKLFWVIGGVTLALLGAVAVAGTTGGGAQRWLNIGPVTMQPSEIAKFTVVVMMARLLTDYGNDMKSFKNGFCKMMILPVAFCAIVLFERHLSGALIILLVGVIMVYAAGAKAKHILLTGILCGAPLATVAVILEPYRISRVLSFLNPFADMKGSGYQVVQSLYAIGSGGLCGVGIGQSRAKHLYLPEAHTDFIFSVVCEELGLLGALLVIVMFAILIITGFKIALKSPDKFSSLLVTGIMSLIAMQVIFNIAVVSSAMPCTGITLPFFSYGGSSLVINLVEMGVVINVSKYADTKNKL